MRSTYFLCFCASLPLVVVGKLRLMKVSHRKTLSKLCSILRAIGKSINSAETEVIKELQREVRGRMRFRGDGKARV